MIKNYWPLTVRILISALFLVSAVSKLFPTPYFAITTFEMKQLTPMGFSPTVAAYLSRILIGIEFALGFLILLPFYRKRIVVPGTILMLLIFVVQLTVEIVQKGNVGNCGCFGALLPMTPLEAIVKNVIAIALLLLYYWKHTETKEVASLSMLLNVVLACLLGMFMLVPIQPEVKEVKVPMPSLTEMNIQEDVDSTKLQTIHTTDSKVDAAVTKDSVIAPIKKVEEPKVKASGYAAYFAGIDKGKKILCFFAPGCEHCKETALELTKLKKQMKDFPEMKILFMDEEAELIPDFFTHCGAKYDFQVLDIVSFWKVIGTSRDTPGVNYLWNGNSIVFYDGINGNKFELNAFKKYLKKEYKDLK